MLPLRKTVIFESGDVQLVTDRTLWRDILDDVMRRMGAGAIDMWLRNVALVDAHREEVVLAVPTRFARQRIEGGKIAEAIASAFEALLGARPAIRVVVDASLRESSAELDPVPAGAAGAIAAGKVRA